MLKISSGPDIIVSRILQYVVDCAFVNCVKPSAVGLQRAFSRGSAVAGTSITCVISGKGWYSTIYFIISYNGKGTKLRREKKDREKD